MRRVIVSFGILSIIISACIETEPVSPVPEITFKSLEAYVAYDSALSQYRLIGELIFDFIDGDADLGIYEDYITEDEWDENNYNVFLIPFEKVDTNYFLIEPDTANPPPWYRIWHNTKLDRVGQNKTIKGTVTLILEDLPDYDTIRYEFYIRDRAGNTSNMETSTDIGTFFDQDLF